MHDQRGMTSTAHDITGSEVAAPDDLERLHPRLQAEFASLTFRSDGTPDRASWELVVAAIDSFYQRRDDVESAMREDVQGTGRFANLFRSSPIPMMEQDYGELVRWMDELREQGVTDIWTQLGDDLASIRSVVPMITITAANPAAIRAVGLPYTQLIGPIDPTIVNEGALPSWRGQIDAVWTQRPIARSSFIGSTAGGRRYDAESVLSAPVVDGTPDFSRAVFTILDVTGHRDEERRMRELVETKNRFLASVSHEIRTPLTAVLGFAAMLDNGDYEDEEDLAGMISSIATHAQDIADLVEDLLVAARAETGQVDITFERFDVLEQIALTLSTGGSFTTDVTVNCNDAAPLAIGDAARVRQILRNLLTNAKKYGGPTVTISVSSSDTHVDIAVSDDGSGLPFSEWDRIFEPYHRAHTAAGITESVGIGLAISRQLAELMAGRLEYRYKRGRSIFTLSLPRN